LREDASTHQSFRANDRSVHEETETDDAKNTTLDDDDEGTPEQWKLAAEELVDRIRWNLPQKPPAPPVRLTSGDGDFPRPTNTAHAKRTMPGGDHARSGTVPDGGWKDLAADTEKREHVKKSMVDAYDAYEKYAFGWDELRPLSKRGKNAFGGLGATIIDSLDTLWIMGLSDHYSRARNWVDEFLFFDRDWEASLFETTIRVLGGLLSAYDLSGDEMYLRKCLELADKLEPAFGTKTGVPLNIVNLKTGETKTPPWTGGPSAVVLSEFGSLAMEFGALSERVGDKKWVTLAETPVKVAIAHSSKRNLPKNVRP
jgi:mannosyl-oligosaccharide alpha-1,2-mannosidase